MDRSSGRDDRRHDARRRPDHPGRERPRGADGHDLKAVGRRAAAGAPHRVRRAAPARPCVSEAMASASARTAAAMAAPAPSRRRLPRLAPRGPAPRSPSRAPGDLEGGRVRSRVAQRIGGVPRKVAERTNGRDGDIAVRGHGQGVGRQRSEDRPRPDDPFADERRRPPLRWRRLASTISPGRRRWSRIEHAVAIEPIRAPAAMPGAGGHRLPPADRRLPRDRCPGRAAPPRPRSCPCAPRRRRRRPWPRSGPPRARRRGRSSDDRGRRRRAEREPRAGPVGSACRRLAVRPGSVGSPRSSVMAIERPGSSVSTG